MSTPIQTLLYLLWPLLALILSVITSQTNAIFLFLFVFRYLRLLVHIVSFYFVYKPTPIPHHPTLHPSDCTIIIPTVDPENNGFRECLVTVLANLPGAIIVVTVGKAKELLVESVVAPFRKEWPNTDIIVTHMDIANKRHQVCAALPLVKTTITVLVDDHAYWPSTKFLNTILAPFEDSQVGSLGTNKRVRRTSSGWNLPSIYNFWGAVYLERHNFEIRSTNAIDGGVFVLSGRTSAHRTSILQDPDFIRGFANETFFFNKLGPLNPDDDNFITRWEVKKRWKLKIQYCEDATMETDLGNPTKYSSQCLRWARTTWRSNSCSLFTDRVVWKSQPWCVYAVFWTSFFNFALFYDWALVYTLSRTTFGGTWTSSLAMALCIFLSKMVKLVPHFIRCPHDLVLIPAYLFIAYWHSLIKLYALLTFWNVRWEGRNLAAIEKQASEVNEFINIGELIKIQMD
jgi:cellulose synthase/poly-beta-1,6-N-acetylglucosamine synthase-like glycosyltransferase